MSSILSETAKAAGWTLAVALIATAFVAGPGGAARLATLESLLTTGGEKPSAAAVVSPAANGSESSSWFGQQAELSAGDGGNFHGEATIDGEQVAVVADTGASSVVLPYDIADRIGLRPAPSDFRIPVTTANGRSFVAPVTLRYVRIGTVELSNVDAAVAMEGAMDGEALLGMTFLGRLRSVQVLDGRLILRN
jgi:aspartyl protease family protein